MKRIAVAAAVALMGGMTSCGEPETSADDSCDEALSWSQAADYIGEAVALRGDVVSAAYLPDTNGEPTFLNVGADYPTASRLSVVIWGEDRDQFGESELDVDALPGQTVCVVGTVSEFEGTAQVTARNSDQLTVNN